MPLTPTGDIFATAPYGGLDEVKVSIRYDGPVPAPIAAGDVIAELVIEAPDLPAVSHPLAAAEAVGPGGVLTRVTGAVTLLLGLDGAPTETAAAE